MTPNLYDLSSAEGVKQIVTALFQGYNYRLYTAGCLPTPAIPNGWQP